MLAAVAIFAVVGGSLAFKAKRFTEAGVCFNTSAVSGQKVTSAVPGDAIITILGAQQYYYTVVSGPTATCLEPANAPTATTSAHSITVE